jgi:cell division protein FtsW (lipid II flippase)
MNWQKIKNHDWAITVVCLLLMILGLLVIFSTTYNTTNPEQGAGSLSKQVVFIVGGFVLYFIILCIDFSWFENRSIVKVIYVVTILLLIYVKFFGTTIAGTNRWIDIGFFNLQPSEYAKIVIILVTAAMFANPETEPYLAQLSTSAKNKRRMLQDRIPDWLSVIRINSRQIEYLRLLVLNSLVILPLIILTLIQPSLGNAMISLFIWSITLLVLFPNQRRLFLFIVFSGLFLALAFNFIRIERMAADFEVTLTASPDLLLTGIIAIALVVLTYISRTRLVHLLLIGLLSCGILAGGILGWNNVLTDYQKIRIDTFLEGPESDPTKAGYQVIQSKDRDRLRNAFGKRFSGGNTVEPECVSLRLQPTLFSLPLPNSSAFWARMIVLVLYTVLIIRLSKIGEEASSSNYAKYVSLGVALLLL